MAQAHQLNISPLYWPTRAVNKSTNVSHVMASSPCQHSKCPVILQSPYLKSYVLKPIASYRISKFKFIQQQRLLDFSVWFKRPVFISVRSVACNLYRDPGWGGADKCNINVTNGPGGNKQQEFKQTDFERGEITEKEALFKNYFFVPKTRNKQTVRVLI